MTRLFNRFGMCVPWTMLLAVMLVVFVAAQPAQAEQRPGTLLRETVDQLLDELSNNRPKYEADKCQLYSVVNRLVLPLFAIDKINRLILGKHFKAVSPQMRNRFSRAFMEMLIRTYATAMFEYTEQGLVPPPPEILELNESAVTVLLRQRVPVAGQAPVLVDYVMWRSKDDHWRILDIRIDHVSLVMAYRLQYDPMVKAKGLEALIHRLETKIEDC